MQSTSLQADMCVLIISAIIESVSAPNLGTGAKEEEKQGGGKSVLRRREKEDWKCHV